MNDIIILSEARTGSNLVCEMFYKYNEFRILNEFFIDADRDDPQLIPHINALTLEEKEQFFQRYNIESKNIVRLTKKIIRRPVSTYEFLEQVIPDYKVIKHHRLMLKKFKTEFLLDKNENFIFITRTDILAQYVSREIALKINKWHNVNTSNEKITVNIDDLLSYRDLYNQGLEYRNKLEKNNKNILDLNYEEDIDNTNKFLLMKKIDDWLKSIGVKVTKNNYSPNFFKKQNHTLMSEMVTNYDEVLTALSKY